MSDKSRTLHAKRAVAVLAAIATTALSFVLSTAESAMADSTTFTSAQVGTSGQTAQFNQAGAWEMAWSFDCTAFGSSGTFSVNINQPAGSPTVDIGPNELSAGESGTDYYSDTGTLSLSIISECTWSISVEPSTVSTASGNAQFSSSTTGDSGVTSPFSEAGNWQMAWSYDCSNSGGNGNFSVSIETASGDTALVGPNELGPGGNGTDSYTQTGTFELSIISECHWSINVTAVASPNPTPSPSPTTTPISNPPPVATPGYWMLGVDGKVYPFGSARTFGAQIQLAGGTHAVHIESTPDGQGYWVVTNGGDVYSAGDAQYFGGAPKLAAGEQVASLSSTTDGAGYWMFTNLGRVIPFGDAVSYGDMSRTHLNGPVLDSVPTASGKGYFMVASDGGIFTFGDAQFDGSMGGKALNGPVVGLAPTPEGSGYWLVANDGGIFSFGAPFEGSMGGTRLNKPVIGMVAYGNGYLMVASDGGIFDFSSTPFLGSLGSNPPPHPIVGVAPVG